MRSDPLAVRITTPVADSVPGRGFYQLEESALYVPVGAADKSQHYFSSLESKRVRLDIDRDGRLMFIEVAAARSTWTVTDEIDFPVWAESADVRFLGFRTTIPEPQILTDRSKLRLLLRFSPALVARIVSPADGVVLSVDHHGSVVSILVFDVVDDLAGREIARFREMLRAGTEPAALQV
jgi:hypothetical protein